LDPDMQQFLQENNPWALQAISERLLEAAGRDLWKEPNAATLEALQQLQLSNEGMLEIRGE
ncbi:MAG: cobaltochelatase subunit CobN, partial [Siphonobacter aquaeclarae]|nr:cobaltochelatase subunit CobN [Siphonobacter aquaeclarae]